MNVENNLINEIDIARKDKWAELVAADINFTAQAENHEDC